MNNNNLDNIKSTLSQQHLSSLTNALDYAISQRLMMINTMLPCKVIAVNAPDHPDTQLASLDVQPIVNMLDASGKPIAYPIIYEVPIIFQQGGNAGIIIEYQGDDLVWVGFAQRDMSNKSYATSSSPKSSPTLVNPATNRMFSLSDGVVLGSYSSKAPEVMVKVTSKGIDIKGKDKPVNVTTSGDISISTTSGAVKVNSANNSIELNASGVTLSSNLQVTIKSPIVQIGESSAGSVITNLQTEPSGQIFSPGPLTFIS